MKFWHWRKMTLLLWGWTALLGSQIVGELGSLETQETELDAAAQAIGTGIGIFFIMVLWFLGFIVLSLIWFMTRPRSAHE